MDTNSYGYNNYSTYNRWDGYGNSSYHRNPNGDYGYNYGYGNDYYDRYYGNDYDRNSYGGYGYGGYSQYPDYQRSRPSSQFNPVKSVFQSDSGSSIRVPRVEVPRVDVPNIPENPTLRRRKEDYILGYLSESGKPSNIDYDAWKRVDSNIPAPGQSAVDIIPSMLARSTTGSPGVQVPDQQVGMNGSYNLVPDAVSSPVEEYGQQSSPVVPRNMEESVVFTLPDEDVPTVVVPARNQSVVVKSEDAQPVVVQSKVLMNDRGMIVEEPPLVIETKKNETVIVQPIASQPVVIESSGVEHSGIPRTISMPSDHPVVVYPAVETPTLITPTDVKQGQVESFDGLSGVSSSGRKSRVSNMYARMLAERWKWMVSIWKNVMMTDGSVESRKISSSRK